MYFKDFLRYRQVWLGIALIWIILFHLPLDFGLINILKTIGYGGVDICIFASGIGCFYSLCSEPDAATFMKCRIKKLAPTYLIFIVVWLFYQYLIGNFEFQMAIGNLFAVQNFTGHGQDFNWYISAIFLFYIIAPYLKAIVEKSTTTNKILFLAFLIAISFPFWNSNTYIITITRLPIFYVGMLFGDICMKNTKITTKHIVGMIVAFILGVVSIIVFFKFASQNLWSFGLYWYPFILITPPLCFAISYISKFFEKIMLTKLIVSFLSICGNHSFELYLVHILLISCINVFISKLDMCVNTYQIWLIGGVFLLVGCFILKRFTIIINKLFKIVNKN